MVPFEQNWLYLGKSGCIRAKIVVFVQKLFYSDKVVVFGQSNRAKWLYLGKSVSIRAKVVVFGQNMLYSDKADVFGQKWLYSG